MKNFSLKSILATIAILGIAAVTVAQVAPPSMTPSAGAVFPPINTSPQTQRKASGSSFLEFYPGILTASTGGFFGPGAGNLAYLGGFNFFVANSNGGSGFGVNPDGFYLKTNGDMSAAAVGNSVLTLDGTDGKTKWAPVSGSGDAPEITTTTTTVHGMDIVYLQKTDWISGGEAGDDGTGLSAQCPADHPIALAVSCDSSTDYGADTCILTPQANFTKPSYDNTERVYAPGTFTGGRMSSENKNTDNDGDWNQLTITCAKASEETVVNSVATDNITDSWGATPTTWTFMSQSFGNRGESCKAWVQRTRPNAVNVQAYTTFNNGTSSEDVGQCYYTPNMSASGPFTLHPATYSNPNEYPGAANQNGVYPGRYTKYGTP